MQQVAETLTGLCGCACVRVISHGRTHRACLTCPQIAFLIWRVSHSQFPAPVGDYPAPPSTGDAREAMATACFRFAASSEEEGQPGPDIEALVQLLQFRYSCTRMEVLSHRLMEVAAVRRLKRPKEPVQMCPPGQICCSRDDAGVALVFTRPTCNS